MSRRSGLKFYLKKGKSSRTGFESFDKCRIGDESAALERTLEWLALRQILKQGHDCRGARQVDEPLRGQCALRIGKARVLARQSREAAIELRVRQAPRLGCYRPVRPLLAVVLEQHGKSLVQPRWHPLRCERTDEHVRELVREDALELVEP